mmetsp:Transcript_21620/g.51086  ORF Transcript_21620/g.51086 Transcript_21620/m.51086 type:complete len:148 (+) Transcript_21620:90-533(+)
MMSVKSILSLVFFAFLVNGSNAFWASAAADDEVLLDFRAGPKTSLGVFFQGNNLDKTIDLETEQFKGIVPPTGRSTQLIKAGDGFVIRSTDFKIRAKVIVWKNTDYKVRFLSSSSVGLLLCDLFSTRLPIFILQLQHRRAEFFNDLI